MRAFGLASLSEYHTLRPRRPHWTLVGQQVRQCQLTARCLEIAADTLLEVVGIQVLLQVPVVTSSILLEMGRREPLWKTSPPFSPQWTRALQSIKKASISLIKSSKLKPDQREQLVWLTSCS